MEDLVVRDLVHVYLCNGELILQTSTLVLHKERLLVLRKCLWANRTEVVHRCLGAGPPVGWELDRDVGVEVPHSGHQLHVIQRLNHSLLLKAQHEGARFLGQLSP